MFAVSLRAPLIKVTILNPANDRRDRPRFPLNVPLTVLVGDRTVAGFTRDLSDRGVYFYLALPDSNIVEGDFEFVVELPPEITLSTWCPIRCQGRLMRKEQTAKELTGIAAQILQYSIFKESVPEA